MTPQQIYSIAIVCHEANRFYCLSHGDHSQPEWVQAPHWQKESAVRGVEFHIANPSASPRASHENWLKEKLTAGWKYGPVKNPDTKEHPCCVDFDQLPEHQQRKDYLFKTIVHALSDPL
jgi:hypothetical protein